MAASGPLVPVLVSAERPEVYTERLALLEEAKRTGGSYNEEYLKQRPSILDALNLVGLDSLRIEPRWIGDATEDCLAALEPSIFTSRGAEERDRLLKGAQQRGEPALVFLTLEPSGSSRSIFSSSARATVSQVTSIRGRSLGRGSRPVIAPGVTSADADLARRVLNTRVGDEWWSLELDAVGVRSPGDFGSRSWGPSDPASGVVAAPQPEGRLLPLLLSPLDEPVMAVWIPANALQRVYVMPPGHDLSQTLEWLLEQGLPEYAPAACRALRLAHAPVPDALLSIQEQDAERVLERLRREYEAALVAATSALTAAKAKADPLRDALLYGQSKDLERAVADVFRDAGCTVIDLDDELGTPASADLLVRADDGTEPVLVEVKSVKGSAPEDLMSKLVKHLEVWPRLRPDTEIRRGLLVVNHHRSAPPQQRPEQVFSRPEFVAAAPHPVVSGAQLLAWWLQEDWAAIRGCVGSSRPSPTPNSNPSPTPPTSEPSSVKRGWLSWRR